MAKNKYEKFFREECNVCGPPFPEFVAFFQSYPKAQARVLDLGCGQGRDSLVAARHGHLVVGVDLSPTGIKQMVVAAQGEGLAIIGVVSDIVTYEPEGNFDVVILDRVLHMLADNDARTAVLRKAVDHLSPGGNILIADTPKQEVFIQTFFDSHPFTWELDKKKKGVLFAQKTDRSPEWL